LTLTTSANLAARLRAVVEPVLVMSESGNVARWSARVRDVLAPVARTGYWSSCTTRGVPLELMIGFDVGVQFDPLHVTDCAHAGAATARARTTTNCLIGRASVLERTAASAEQMGSE
jgi:hypothetical protein